MTLYVLDTDHISLQQRAHPSVVRRLQTILPGDSVAVTIISAEEQIRGRLEIIRRHSASPLQSVAYGVFRETLQYFATWLVLDFTSEAYDQFLQLRRQRIRIGSQDLRIASIALLNNAVLVTRNTKDFSQVPNLIIEDWSTA